LWLNAMRVPEMKESQSKAVTVAALVAGLQSNE
jgi:hypothetical protein